METTTLYLAAQSLISFRPAFVSTYFCFDEFGLSGIVGVARWVSKSIFKHVCLNLVRHRISYHHRHGALFIIKNKLSDESCDLFVDWLRANHPTKMHHVLSHKRLVRTSE